MQQGQFEIMDLRRMTEYAAVSERTLRNWIAASENPLPASRIGGKIYVKRSEFDRWFENHAVKKESSRLDQLIDEVAEEFRGRGRKAG